MSRIQSPPFIACLLAACGCAAATVALAADDAATVVAKRGTAVVTLGEVDARIAEIPPDKRAGFVNSPERIEQMLQQLLLLEQLANEALAEKLDQDPEYLAQLDLTRKRLLAQMKQRQIMLAAPSVDAAALAHERYLADPKRFAAGETVSVRHILLRPGAPAAADERRAEAEKLRARVLAGESIEALAKEHSDDRASAQQGGLIADVSRGRTVKAFEDAAFALAKPGDVAPVVETEFGFHVVALVERKPARSRSFEEVKEQLMAEIENTERAKGPTQHMEQLNSMPLEAEPEVVASLRTRYGKVELTPTTAAATPGGQ